MVATHVYSRGCRSSPESPILSEIVNDDQDDTYLVSWSSVATADNYELAERFSGGSWQTVYTGTATSQERIHQSAGNWCYRARASIVPLLVVGAHPSVLT